MEDATKHPKMPQNKLSPRQLIAIEMLAAGKNSTEVANTLGVDRKILWRWKTENPYFIAELNKNIKELWLTAKERLNSLVSKAVDVLSDGLNEGDKKVAVEILKATNLYGRVGSPSRDTNPDLVMTRQAENWDKEFFFYAPSPNPTEQLRSAQNVIPILTVEKYLDLREEWEEKIGEDYCEETMREE